MIPGLAAILHAAAIGPQGGYELFTGVGNYQHTVRPGITSLCILVIGEGGPYFDDSENGTGSGGGGACAWANNISVTPGGLINIGITPTVADPYSEGTSYARLGFSPFTTVAQAGAGRIPAPGIAYAGTGFDGGQGVFLEIGSGRMEGGGAGGKSAGQAANGTRTRRGGGGTNPFALGPGANAGASPNLNGQNYGGGAAYGGSGGSGCALVMWGDGFSFPDNIVSP